MFFFAHKHDLIRHEKTLSKGNYNNVINVKKGLLIIFVWKIIRNSHWGEMISRQQLLLLHPITHREEKSYQCSYFSSSPDSETSYWGDTILMQPL